METKEKLSKLLRDIRVQKSLTIKEVAERSGITERYISYLEKGTYLPSLDTLVLISKALNINPKVILEALWEKEE